MWLYMRSNFFLFVFVFITIASSKVKGIEDNRALIIRYPDDYKNKMQTFILACVTE